MRILASAFALLFLAGCHQDPQPGEIYRHQETDATVEVARLGPASELVQYYEQYNAEIAQAHGKGEASTLVAMMAVKTPEQVSGDSDSPAVAYEVTECVRHPSGSAYWEDETGDRRTCLDLTRVVIQPVDQFLDAYERD
jgi:hypothetical protein